MPSSLIPRQGHHFLLPIAVIVVVEADRFLGDVQQAGFADGNLAGVACRASTTRSPRFVP
nr:hypothetical protein [Thiothrix lacustris]